MNSIKKRENSCLAVAAACFTALVILLSCIIAAPAETGREYIAAATDTERMTVVIDPGHGGEDCGAIGYSGIYEKDLNMQISVKLGEYLSAAGVGVVFTRTEDKLLYTEEQNIKGMRKIYDLRNRTEIANTYGTNALLVSIHMNSFGARECSGMQIYHADNDSSRMAADKIRTSVIYSLQPDNRRGLKNGKELYLLENAEIPAILIECGFISNPDECERLAEAEYQKELCFAIMSGILEYEKIKSSS
ncbi:MAG: cell wall hydrolase [Ruminococcaceae bacterium]|nr:cell wall hydrolase [Oscillospiraceae bacterium]